MHLTPLRPLWAVGCHRIVRSAMSTSDTTPTLAFHHRRITIRIPRNLARRPVGTGTRIIERGAQ